MSSDDPAITRRGLLGAGAGAAATFIAQRLGAAPPGCADPTAAQVEGPYYPTRDGLEEDPDLTRVKGRSGRAQGQVIVVQGRVLDEECRPVAGALVEIWQANTWGRYDHELDAGNPRPLDPGFQSWAEMRTDAGGRFRFRTIKPGAYPADDQGWVRPPHIHFKVSRRGYHELITQMYFAGEALNEADRIRAALPEADRARLTVAFGPAAEDQDGPAATGSFDITLRQVG